MAELLEGRRHAEAILRAAIAAAAPGPLVRHALQGAGEIAGGGVRVIAVGKAAPPMARAACDELGERVLSCLVVAPHDVAGDDTVVRGAHPVPDASSVAAGARVLEALRACRPAERLLVLLSGGASSIIAYPLDGIDIDEYAACVRGLMQRGADIAELNTVRRHIDRLKGGRAARIARGVPTLCVALSDVVGDAPDVIASGPLSPDPTTREDARVVLRRLQLWDQCAPSIRAALEAGEETPKPGDAVFDTVRVRIVGGNLVAREGAATAAEALGYTVRRAPLPVTGEAHEAGESLAAEALAMLRDGSTGACIIAGGETTVTVRGAGRGGRNQELVLAACIALGGAQGIVVGSVGTDGVDGASDAAGAVADEQTLRRAAAAGVDPSAALAANDSYSFFRDAGGLIVTGPTGTNVNDVHVALIGAPTVTQDDPPSTSGPRHP